MKRHQPFPANPRKRTLPPVTVTANRVNHAIVKVDGPGVTVTVHAHQVDALGHPMTTVEIIATGATEPLKGKPWWIEGEGGNKRTKVRVIQRTKL